MEMIPCVKCKKDMPLLRKEKFGYNFCINCSDISKRSGVSFTFGEGEDTWEETVIMEDSTFKLYLKAQKENKKRK